MSIAEYLHALSADTLHHTITFVITAVTVFLVMAQWGKLRLEESISALQVEKNDQFRAAITTSFDEVVQIMNHHSKLSYDAQKSGDVKTRTENYPRYALYAEVYSYALALKKHGWKQTTEHDSHQVVE